MMKKLVSLMLFVVLACLFLAGQKAHAAAGHAPGGSAGIVTPDVARGAFRLPANQVTYDTAGELVYCPSPKSSIDDCRGGKVRWTRLRDMVPSGTKYVGFSLVSGYYGATSYDVYWK